MTDYDNGIAYLKGGKIDGEDVAINYLMARENFLRCIDNYNNSTSDQKNLARIELASMYENGLAIRFDYELASSCLKDVRTNKTDANKINKEIYERLDMLKDIGFDKLLTRVRTERDKLNNTLAVNGEEKEAAKVLLDNLSEKAKAFINGKEDRTKEAEIFKTGVVNAIKTALPLLPKDEWMFLTKALSAILSFGTLGAVNLISGRSTYNLFSSRGDTRHKMKAVEKKLDKKSVVNEHTSVDSIEAPPKN